MKKLRFDVAGLSDAGIIKAVNQDSFVYKVADAGNYYAAMLAVADGVGGLSAGEKASGTAIANLNRWWERQFREHYADEERMTASLLENMQRTNASLFTQGTDTGARMATTLSVLVFHHNRYLVMHVGDSRIYRMDKRRGPLTQLTQDQVAHVPGGGADGTGIKKVLSECLGYRESFLAFTAAGTLHRDDLFLCCSDGIYKRLPPQAIAEVLHANRKSPVHGCSALVERAKQSGETDNITAILANVFA